MTASSSLSPIASVGYEWLLERRIIGSNDLEPVAAAAGTDAYEASHVVARMETRTGAGFCSAVRVGRSLFLTNHHCQDVVPCERVVFQMGYQPEVRAADRAQFACVRVLASDARLDYALYRVDPILDSDGESRADSFPIGKLWDGPLWAGQPLVLASHPGARHKEIDRSDDCVLLTAVPVLFAGRMSLFHSCDTEGSSSGAPVFDRETLAIVALHWGGTDDSNKAIRAADVIADLRLRLPPATLRSLSIGGP